VGSPRSASAYSTAVQVGTAIGLAAFSVVAVSSAPGSTVTDQVHGQGVVFPVQTESGTES
jgi:hypothetical protein